MAHRPFARRLARTVALGIGSGALVAASLGAIPAGASTPTRVGAGSNVAPQMSLSCTFVAFKFNYGAELRYREGASALDQANGQNLMNMALDAWYRNGCDQYGLMPIW